MRICIYCQKPKRNSQLTVAYFRTQKQLKDKRKAIAEMRCKKPQCWVAEKA